MFKCWKLAVPLSLKVDKGIKLNPFQANRFIAGILYRIRESTLESNKDLFRESIVAIDYNIPTSKEVYKAIITCDLSSAINPGEGIWKGSLNKHFVVPWERSYKLYNNWFKQDTFFWFKHCKLLRGEVPFLRGMCDMIVWGRLVRDIGADYCDDSIYIAFFVLFSIFYFLWDYLIFLLFIAAAICSLDGQSVEYLCCFLAFLRLQSLSLHACYDRLTFVRRGT